MSLEDQARLRLALSEWRKARDAVTLLSAKPQFGYSLSDEDKALITARYRTAVEALYAEASKF